MIPIARPILGEDELAAVKDVLASGMLAQGAKVKAFEEAFARDVGRKHGIAVANGTAALHVALLAHGLKAGAEVVIPPLTFFATASTVLLCGAKPVFADIDPMSLCLDPADVERRITERRIAEWPLGQPFPLVLTLQKIALEALITVFFRGNSVTSAMIRAPSTSGLPISVSSPFWYSSTFVSSSVWPISTSR